MNRNASCHPDEVPANKGSANCIDWARQKMKNRKTGRDKYINWQIYLSFLPHVDPNNSNAALNCFTNVEKLP